MEKTLNLLMTETSPELSRLCKMTLPNQNIEVTVCPRNGVAAYSELVRLKPDAMLMDIFMPGMDAITLKNKFADAYPESTTVFYATGTFQNEDIERELLQTGFAFYFLKPFDVSVLGNRLQQNFARSNSPAVAAASGANAMVDEEDMITDMLRMIGVPAHIKGYRFLRECVLRSVENPELIDSVTRALYPQIAEANNTTASRVERAVRHAIEVAWDRGDIEILNFYFGSTVQAQRGKPTNSEFIAMLADRVMMAQKRRA